MKIDLTTIIALILALFAFVSPIITAIVDNRYKLKMKQIERFNNVRENVINDFINATFDCNFSGVHKEHFYKCLNKVLIYVDEKSSKKLGKVKYCVETRKSITEINSALMEFILVLNGAKETKSKK